MITTTTCNRRRQLRPPTGRTHRKIYWRQSLSTSLRHLLPDTMLVKAPRRADTDAPGQGPIVRFKIFLLFILLLHVIIIIIMFSRRRRRIPIVEVPIILLSYVRSSCVRKKKKNKHPNRFIWLCVAC